MNLQEYKANEIVEMLVEHQQENHSKFKWYDIADNYFENDNPNLDVKFEDSYGGEGQGDQYWSVYKVINRSNSNDFRLIKFDGYYSSYNGHEWSDYFFVTPTQVTVTKYIQDGNRNT